MSNGYIILAIIAALVAIIVLKKLMREKPDAAFNSACKVMKNDDEKLYVACIYWHRVLTACRNPKTDITKEIAGVANLWLSIIHLLCAEKSKIMSIISTEVYTGSIVSKVEKPSWPDSANDSIAFAKNAMSLLGPADIELLSLIIKKAETQKNVSSEFAKQESNYKEIIETSRGGSLAFPTYLPKRSDIALLKTDMKIKDLLLYGKELMCDKDIAIYLTSKI